MRPVSRFFLIFFISIFVLIGALVAFAGWFLHSANFAELIEERLTSATGYEWKINGSLDLSIIPLTIDATDVQVIDPKTGKELFTVGKLQSGVAIRPLFSKQVLIDRVRLDEPVVYLSKELFAGDKDADKVDEDKTDKSSKVDQPDKADQPDNIDASGKTGAVDLPLDKIAAIFNLEGIDITRGRIVWEQDAEGEKKFVAANNLELTIDLGKESTFALSSEIESNIVPLKGKFETSGSTRFEFETLTLKTVVGDLAWNGEVELEGRTLPTTLAIEYTTDYAQKVINFSKLKAEIADEALLFSGKMANIDSSEWKLTGQAEVQHLSLPFWFGFTENIPTSLSHALDDLNGTVTLEMDKNGLKVPTINATVLGMKLSGRGGVADFSDPVIFIDAHGKNIDVNKIFPEISLNPPKELPRPRLDMPPIFRFEDEPEDLTPEERKKREEEEFSVGYDINVSADTATAYGFTINDLSFRCWPAPETGTLTSYDIGGMYGGSVESLLTIRDDLRLEVEIKDVQLKEISRILTGDSVIAGVANGNVDVRFHARTLVSMLAGIGGTVDAVITDGYIKSFPKEMPDGSMQASENEFTKFTLDLVSESMMEDPDKAVNDLHYNWDLSVLFTSKGKDSTYNTKLKGPVIVSMKRALPVRAENADLDIAWHGTMDVRGRQVTAPWTLQSKLTYDLNKEDAEITNGTLTFDGQAFRVDLTARKFLSDPIIRGSFNGENFNLQSLLRTLGMFPWETQDPEALTSASVQGLVDLREGRYALYDVEGNIDNSTIGGAVLVNFNSEIPMIRADVKLDDVILQKYFPPEDVDVHAKVFTKKPWNLDWLYEYDIKGSLNVDKLKYKTVEIEELVGKVTVGNGEIKVGPIEANLYKGSFSGDFTGTYGEKLQSRFAANINGVDMSLASKGAVGEDYIGGITTAYLEGQGRIGSNWEILSNVRGIWGVSIKKGFFGFEKDDEGVIEKTTFESAVSDGSIGGGIMQSDNFVVKSKYVDIRGGGFVNLLEKEIDYKVNATFARIPSVPVAITGKWDDPEVKVDGLSVVPRTIGKLGGGVFSIVKDAFLIPFRAVDLLRSAQ